MRAVWKDLQREDDSGNAQADSHRRDSHVTIKAFPGQALHRIFYWFGIEADVVACSVAKIMGGKKKQICRHFCNVDVSGLMNPFFHHSGEDVDMRNV